MASEDIVSQEAILQQQNKMATGAAPSLPTDNPNVELDVGQQAIINQETVMATGGGQTFPANTL
jgi:hypothetical protein